MADQTQYKPRTLRVANQSGADIPPYSVMEIYSWDYTKFIAQLLKPSKDNMPAQRLICTGPGLIPSGETAIVSLPEAGKLWVKYADGAGTPAIGDEVGTVANEVELAVDQAGFMVIGVNSTDKTVCVSPFDLPPRLVQNFGTATSPAGEIKVAYIDYGLATIGNQREVKKVTY